MLASLFYFAGDPLSEKISVPGKDIRLYIFLVFHVNLNCLFYIILIIGFIEEFPFLTYIGL
jgi:hypothetical protein